MSDNYAKQIYRPGLKGGLEALKGGPIVFFDTAKGPPPETNGQPYLWCLWKSCPGGARFRLVGEDGQKYKERTEH